MMSLRHYVITIALALCAAGGYAQTSEMETRYNALAARFDGRDKQLQRDLKTYLQAYPYTTFADEVNFMQGVLQVEKGHYKQSLKILEQVEAKALTRPHQTDYSFYRGYAYLMMQDYQRASVYFGQLSKSESRYTTRALYYYAYCRYQQGKYDEALPALLQLEDNAAYSKTIPYYIVQIYYAQKNYGEVTARAENLLRTYPEASNNTELHRILGEIYYAQKNYGEAKTHLRQYRDATTALKEQLVRTDMYMLGLAEYETGEYEAAVKSLKQVKQEKDSVSESACLTMGNAYLQLNQPEQAKLSFQAAANYNLTPAITEEAAYNYTLCTYQSSSALGESVKAFNDFLHRFPDSRYESRIYQLLSSALMQSKNYAAAISVLDSIGNPTPKMLQTKQYLRYQLVTLEAADTVGRAFVGKPVALPEQARLIPASLCWGGDVAKMFKGLIFNEKALGEDFNVTTSEARTWEEIADYYKEICGLKAVWIDKEDYLSILETDPCNLGRRWQLEVARLFNRVYDNSKMLAATGLKQSDFIPLRKGLEYEISRCPKDYPFKNNERMDAFFAKH